MTARSPLDRLTLTNVKLCPRIGVTAGERKQPQACEADITVWGDFGAAASTDRLDKALDYSRVLSTAVVVSEAREYNLIETLAYHLAREILRRFPAERVGVRVRKRPAGLLQQLDHVEVEVEES